MIGKKRNCHRKLLLSRKLGHIAIILSMALLFSSCFMNTQDITVYSSYDEGHFEKSSMNSEKLKETLSKEKICIPENYFPAKSIQPAEKKQLTVMIYMNGSDLESQNGLASDDINEMLDSGFNQNDINLLIFTGGTSEWRREEIPDNKNAIMTIEGGNLVKLADAGETSIANPEVLAGFIKFCNKYFPAEKTGLIMWNHGGGAVAGFGSDERYEFPDNSMFLYQLDLGLGNAGLVNKLEFIAFDACLLATLEMACIVDNYGRYLIASEELEPDDGLNYSFLGSIQPDFNGAELGKIIVDSFKDTYIVQEPDAIITISLINLSKIRKVEKAMEKFAKAAHKKLGTGSFNKISKARSACWTLANQGYRSVNSEMVDVYQLADSLKNLMPTETTALKKAVAAAVDYKFQNNLMTLGGLSIYFPLTEKEALEDHLSIYRNTGIMENYGRFIAAFANILTGKPIEENWEVRQIVSESAGSPGGADGKDYQIKLTNEQLENLSEVRFTIWQQEESIENNLDYYVQLGELGDARILDDGTVTAGFDGQWVALQDYYVCMYELDRNNEQIRYTIPAYLNDLDVDLIAVKNKHYPNGRVVGAMPVSESPYEQSARSMIKIKQGDVIVPYYYAELFITDSKQTVSSLDTPTWYGGEEIIVNSGLYLEKVKAGDGKYLYGFTLIDTQQNAHYSEFVSVDILDENHKRRFRDKPGEV